jgi:hypothetical protein
VQGQPSSGAGKAATLHLIPASFGAGAGGGMDQRQGKERRVHVGSLAKENGVHGRKFGSATVGVERWGRLCACHPMEEEGGGAGPDRRAWVGGAPV